MKRRIATPRSNLGTHFAGEGTSYTKSDPEYDPALHRTTSVRFDHDDVVFDKKNDKAWYKLNGPIKTYNIKK